MLPTLSDKSEDDNGM